MRNLVIHPELRALIPPLSEEERKQLIDNLRAEGCRDALVIWQEENTILDGHNRYDICQTYELPFDVKHVSLSDIDEAKIWMLRHQLGRRNLLPDQMSYLRGKERELVGISHGGDRKSSGQNVNLKTDAQLADEHKVSEKTIRRDAAYAKAVDAIAEVAPEAKQDILSRDTRLTRDDVKALASIAKESPPAAKHVFEAVKVAPTPKAAKEIIHTAAKPHKVIGITAPDALQGPAPAPAASRQSKPYDVWIHTLTTLDRLGKEINVIYPTLDEDEQSTLGQMMDLGLITLEHALALLRPPPPPPAKVSRSTSTTKAGTKGKDPTYDATKFVLGKLCPGRHDYRDSGKTLLTLKKRRCQSCENEKGRAKRRQRAGKEAT